MIISILRFGTPEEIAAMWEDELSVTPSRMKWLFIAVNIFFFGGGAVLTLAHNLLDWNWISRFVESVNIHSDTNCPHLYVFLGLAGL